VSQHIVIVEDDVVTRRRLAAQLKQQMYRVSEAADAAAMDDILARDPADVLLVDINLDGKDGLTITREQRAASNVGIILLTSRTDQIDRIVGLELGADDYVTKPFDKREAFRPDQEPRGPGGRVPRGRRGTYGRTDDPLRELDARPGATATG
jgi:DNA-binding response OmpR family regulator